MHLRIVDDDGNLIGELSVSEVIVGKPDKTWLELLTYASKRWEEQADLGSVAIILVAK